jgi:hypothetical protein
MAEFSGLVSVEALVMGELTLIAAAALALFHPPVAKVVHRRPVTRKRRA